jgi:hypothetical protein
MISDFLASRKEWMHGPFLELKGADIERDVSDWWKTRSGAAILIDTGV